jgi:hypothetical protein
MNIEPHHTRIHWKTRLIRLSLAPLALAAGPAWLYFSLSACQEEGDAVDTLCRAYRVIPFLPTLAALTVLSLVVYDLIEVGRELHQETHGVKPKRHFKHAHAGFKALAPRHQKHIHRTLLNILLVTCAVAVWICWKAWQSTH